MIVSFYSSKSTVYCCAKKCVIVSGSYTPEVKLRETVTLLKTMTIRLVSSDLKFYYKIR